ncbi:MAG: hypothetical protein FWG63_03180 [Defluviitaleaceae bacterium]|nr:hypothetical protein [Defluviitaleaceae bacterium]
MNQMNQMNLMSLMASQNASRRSLASGNSALGRTGEMLIRAGQQRNQVNETLSDPWVHLNISDEGVASAREQMLTDLARDLQSMREQMAEVRQQTEAAAAFWRAQIKALRIAGRIINGDNVPQEDHNFLQDHDPALYGKAMSLRRVNEDPTDYESLYEKERRHTSGSSTALNAGGGRATAALQEVLNDARVSGNPSVSVDHSL